MASSSSCSDKQTTSPVSEPCNCVPCQDLRQANAHLGDALERRRLAMAKANRHHDPFANRLSPEVVSQIFQHCLPSPEYVDDLPIDYWNGFKNDIVQGSFTPLLFGAVCQHWRRIAWSTPRLWWLLSVNLHGSFDDKRLQLSREWLDRSGNLPLVLYVDTRDRNRDLGRPYGVGTQLMASFMTMLSHYVHRASTLFLHAPASGLFHLQPTQIFGKQLKSLSIFNDTDSPPLRKLFAGNTPTPQKLYIGGFSVEDVGIGWGSLTHISGCHMSLEEWIKIFRTATNIVHWQIVEPPDVVDFAWDQQRVVHSKLSTLLVDWSPNIFWDLFSFPGLKTLRAGRIYIPDEDDFCDLDTIRSFLSASGCTLRSLEIRLWEEIDEIISFLDPHIELEELILSPPISEDFMRYLGDTIRPSDACRKEELDASGGDQPLKFLPKLRKFVFKDGRKTFDWTSIPYMLTGAYNIPDLLCKHTNNMQLPRRLLQDVQFNLYLHTSTSEDPDEIKEDTFFLLDHLIRSGFSIAINDVTPWPEKVDVLAEARKKYQILFDQPIPEYRLK